MDWLPLIIPCLLAIITLNLDALLWVLIGECWTPIIYLTSFSKVLQTFSRGLCQDDFIQCSNLTRQIGLLIISYQIPFGTETSHSVISALIVSSRGFNPLTLGHLQPDIKRPGTDLTPGSQRSSQNSEVSLSETNIHRIAWPRYWS